MENPDYAFIPQHLKKQNWPESAAALNERKDTDSIACATNWNLTAPKRDYDGRKSSNSNSYTKSWTKPDVA
jgi:hypothetical protein